MQGRRALSKLIFFSIHITARANLTVYTCSALETHHFNHNGIHPGSIQFRGYVRRVITLDSAGVGFVVRGKDLSIFSRVSAKSTTIELVTTEQGL